MSRDERAAIARALAAAEQGTTGRIGVRVIPDRSCDAFERAEREFVRAGLHAHRHGNAVMILVAPKARRFAIIGDGAIHARVGDAFWRDVVEQTQRYFAERSVCEGIVYAVGRVGEALHEHFEDGQEEVR